MHPKLVLLLVVGFTASLVSGVRVQYDITPYHHLFAGSKTSVTNVAEAVDKLYEDPDHLLAEQVYGTLSVLPEKLMIGKYSVKKFKELAVLSKEKCDQSQLFQRISNMCSATQIPALKKYCKYCDKTLANYCFPYE